MTHDAPSAIDSQQLVRYARHLTLPEVGVAGQARLRAARVLLVGAGGLGSPAALYLAAAGVGRLGLVDDDRVDLTNLQRQVLYGTDDLGRPKLDAAVDRLRRLNPDVDVVPHPMRLTAANALEVVRDYDIVVDGSDNFPTRYLVNDACALTQRPYVYGAIFRFDGQVSLFDAQRGPCYRCLYADPPPPELVPSCVEGGVLGVVPGVIGSLQALEALKWILGAGEPLLGRLLLVDGLRMRFRELALVKDPGCPLCGTEPSIHELIDYEAFCGAAPPSAADEIDPAALQGALAGGHPPLLVDVREPFECAVAPMADAVRIPLGELAGRLNELDPRREIVTVCHRGVRSLRAAALLRGAGFSKVRSLEGGIDRWAREVDPSVPLY